MPKRCVARAVACAAVCLLAATATAAQRERVPWTEVRSEAGFTAALPGAFERRSETRMTPDGLATTTSLEARYRGATFRVCYTEFSGGVPAPAGEVLDATREEWLLGLEGKLVRERPIEVDGRPGRERIVRFGGDRMLWGWVVVTTRRVYAVTVEAVAELMTDDGFEDACRVFLGSFELAGP